jgi:hypothetical protein
MKAVDELLNQAPTLHSLMDRVRQSQACLQAIATLLPANLKAHLQAGPIDDEEWCVLVRSPAVSTKLRQLEPRLLTHLKQQGFSVHRIRIKIQSRT